MMAFIKTHLPCDDCGSSDARSVDDGGGLTVSLATHANLQTVMPLRRSQSLSQQRKHQR
jgi:hypothetical protein